MQCYQYSRAFPNAERIIIINAEEEDQQQQQKL